MIRVPSIAAVTLACVLSVAVTSCGIDRSPLRGPATGDPGHAQRVMTSAFCAECHPAIYAEHELNTHGRAFTDEEVRLATGRFDHGDCIRCHTPRPIFETGIGMNPMRRHHNLTEGNTCMSCHWREGYDYAAFHGGAQCTEAFDPRVGEVEACASCHRNHGTPYQWEKAPTGKRKGRTCMSCHMEKVTRPVAIGEPPRPVRSHVFPGCRSEKQIRRAYAYQARIDGNVAVVRIENKGAGHNLPTELKQRSLESLIVVRDANGEEIARSRMVFRDPYKRPYGLKLPVNTQIPAGEAREHRVPLPVAAGTVDCELHFKLYYPIGDHHPDLARRLEKRRLVFDDIVPSEDPIEATPEVAVITPEGIAAETAGAGNLVDFARPPIGTVEIDVPKGNGPDDIARLIELFQFPVPEGNRRAQDRLVEIGAPAVPALVEAMGSWDNKTWKQAMKVLVRIGDPAAPAVLGALDHEQLYVRIHARRLVGRMALGGRRDAVRAALVRGLGARHPLERAASLDALASAHAVDAAPRIRPLLGDADPDVVRAAARALAALGDEASRDQIVAAMSAAFFPETRRELAESAAMLGAVEGIPILLEGLDHRDDLLREDSFESLFAVTGVHLGYDPLDKRPLRLAAIGRLQSFWAENGSSDLLRRPPRPDERTHAHAWHLVSKLAGGAGTVAGGDDAAIVPELVAMGEAAVPALVLGLKFAPGFANKRSRICDVLGRIGSREAAPALAAALRDPVLAVAAWACWALERVGDPEVADALRRYHDRLLSADRAGTIPANLRPVDRLLAGAARARLRCGDASAAQDLIVLLLSDDRTSRAQAIEALRNEFGEARGYDPDAPLDQRRAAARRWQE